MNKWHIITVGHLTRNIYWGEDNRKAYHPCVATCTAVETENGVVVIDPSLPAEAMQKELYDQSGVRAEDVAFVYCTHCHLDHWSGTEVFRNARILMPEKDLAYLKEDRALYTDVRGAEIDRMETAFDNFLPGMKLLPLPGHSLGLCGLLFDGPEGKILATGDACMGYEYFQAKRGYFWSADYELSSRSIGKAAEAADVIIPGHGNYFFTKAYMFARDVSDAEMPKAVPGVITEYTPLKEIICEKRKAEILLSYLPNMNIAALKIARDVPLCALLQNMPEEVQAQKEKFLASLN